MNAIAKLADSFAETEIDDEIVLMRLDTGEFFSLTGTGREIWRLIDGARDRRELIAALTARFEGDEAEVARDVDEFLAQLSGAGLLAGG